MSVTADGGALSSVVDLSGDSTYNSFVDCINSGVNEGFDADDKLRRTGSAVKSERALEQIADAVDTIERLDDVRAFGSVL